VSVVSRFGELAAQPRRQRLVADVLRHSQAALGVPPGSCQLAGILPPEEPDHLGHGQHGAGNKRTRPDVRPVDGGLQVVEHVVVAAADREPLQCHREPHNVGRAVLGLEMGERRT
jgi:hypothetical protein